VYKVTPTIVLNAANQWVPHFSGHEAFRPKTGGKKKGKNCFSPKAIKENLIKNRVKRKTKQLYSVITPFVSLFA
jgi:hypothetical protein